MSDSVEDLVKQYNENVYKNEYPRSIGLFTIPEYPELEAERGMWSAALEAILTTLRYLAPATLLTIFWGQQSFLFKILKHIDSAFRSIVFSSEEQKQAVLQWLAEAGPVRVEHLDTIWRHGWILCRVLDTALPGACAGHPPTRLSMKHAQAIAEHYLGVESVFTHHELDSNDSLSRHQEWKLATYLDRIRQALSKLTPPVSKPVSQRTSPDNTQFILDYVAKGSGLAAVQINNKAHFKIYPTAQQSLDPGEVTILIRGPRDTYGMAVIPPILGKAQMIRHKILGLQSKQTYTENVLPVTQGAVYLRNYGKNDMNKTYYIPKTQYDIDIDVDSKPDHVKISYMVKLDGKYMVSITSRGQSIAGSPFTVIASNNIINALEKDSFCLEDGEEVDIVDVQNDKKVVLRIVDFVTEKMLLKENGTLEKISDEDAKILMTINKDHKNSDINKETCIKAVNSVNQKSDQCPKFKSAAFKILTMYKVCRIFKEVFDQKQLKRQNEIKDNYQQPRSHQDIPDVVNSTFTEININPYVVSEMREKIIVPECISVSLRAEISKTFKDDTGNNTISKDEDICVSIPAESKRLNTPDSLEIQIFSSEDEEDTHSVDRQLLPTGNNPFLNEMFDENYAAANNFGTFVASEYETNNSQNEETKESSIKIIIDPDLTTSSMPTVSPILVNKNPFIEERVTVYERPKTPVFKIISGEKINRDESVFIDPKTELLTEEELGNEFVNPFFIHQFQSNQFDHMPMADFIIGAPVSLPPMVRASSPQPEMKSLIITQTENTERHKRQYDTRRNSTDAIRLHNNASVQNEHKGENLTSLDSNSTENIGNSNSSTASDSQFESDQNDSNRNVTPRKDMWDSAYVSIDDSNSSPDSNNNENLILYDKQNISSNDETNRLKLEEIANMGPAEREIWQTCSVLNCNTNKAHEEIKPYKWEIKRPIFTPIIEESDRSISAGTKDLSIPEIASKQVETDSVSVAFAELNDMYLEYFPNLEGSKTNARDPNSIYSMHKECNQVEDRGVDSASEISDVKRHDNDLEGTISEVQTSVTESVSVSQILRNEQDHSNYSTGNRIQTQFGENRYSNIVLEKKKYWDDRIREIEAKAQETFVPKKRRSSSKQLKHDSLSKRKGKQMIKNFLSSGDYSQVTNINQVDDKESVNSTASQSLQFTSVDDTQIEPVIPDEKLVAKWKKFWDEKVETDQVQTEGNNITVKTLKYDLYTPTPEPHKSANATKEANLKADINHIENEIFTNTHHTTPIKQELPEEIFKAFETSPKRFFGTSRKQILNKIDTFMGKPINVDTPTTNVTISCHESGLVSSRISLFHNMSNTEELPWAGRKSQSLQNIFQKKESGKSVASVQNISSVQKIIDVQSNASTEPVDNMESKTNKIIDTDTLKSDSIKIQHDNTSSGILSERYTEQSDDYKYKNNISNNTANDKCLSSRLKIETLRKKSFSKSEMDIFNKRPNDTSDELDKYKSCDELPKINVKSFISLYESVSKNTDIIKPAKRVYRTRSADSQTTSNSITLDAVPKGNIAVTRAKGSSSESKCTIAAVAPIRLYSSKTSRTVSNMSLDTRISDSCEEVIQNGNKESIYLSLSDIELEIIESSSSKVSECSPELEVKPEHIEYKNRFKLAKEYFQSLEELRQMKGPRKLNECELLLRKHSIESLHNEQSQERPPKRVKKNIKSRSLPSSEIAKGLSQLQDARQERCASEENSTVKLVKISEKFNVDDLFSDVTEGKLSRQGSLRGIPHKKAVLEAFRSMENVADTKISSYEISYSQLTDFSKVHRVTNAQTYLSEYPYLPKTDPSKYHSRIDVKASGLISLKELKEKKQRRNSVPDLRLNPNFTVDL